jgi:glycosyltransferase involved in cell wall biosynthesis
MTAHERTTGGQTTRGPMARVQTDGGPPGRMQVVVFSEVKWRYMRTRKRFLLARFPADWPILFLEPLNRTDPSHIRPVVDGRVTVASLPVLKSKTTFRLVNALLGSALARALLTALVGYWVAHLLRAHTEPGLPRLFYLSNVLFLPVAERFEHALLLYDANDDPLGFPGTPPWVARYLERTLEQADVVVSCSAALAARLAAHGAREISVIGNGAEVEHFMTPVDPARIPATIRSLARPRIGYAGAIAEWFDFELIAELAAAYPTTPLLIVGPVATPVRAAADQVARAHPNVVFTGRVAYEDLPHWVAQFDVALIPFRIGPATDVLNPNKLYEYLASGRTVVSLAYSQDLAAFAPWIHLARDRAGFVPAVGAALAAPRDAATLRAVAAEHSWDARAASLLALIGAGRPASGSPPAGSGAEGSDDGSR